MSRVPSGGITCSYDYSAHNRVVEVLKNNVVVGEYGCDAFEHRVWREVFSPSTVLTHYIYDLDGRLLAEQNGATGAVVKEYAWIDDMPLAVIDSSSGRPTPYYIYTGPVNEPLAMTNSAKAIVWNAYMEPFGAATVFGTASASIDMRLPGQSLEAETGNLNQNWFRDYDPSLGRYIEADPLGLEAGQNVYAYVDGKPLDWSDPTGLAKHDPNSARCLALKQKIQNIQQDLSNRYDAIDNNQNQPNPLPERIGPGESLSSTVRGHRTIINKYDRNLRNLQSQYDQECGPPPPGTCPVPSQSPSQSPSQNVSPPQLPTWQVLLLGLGLLAAVGSSAASH